MDSKMIQRMTAFFYEVGNLRKVPRAHQQALLTNDRSDNIASHSFRAAFIGYFLAVQLGADANKVLKMCLLHDLPEVRTNDHNWVHKKYTKVYEGEVRQDQFAGLLCSEEFSEIAEEYEDRQTLEAKIAKDADLLDQIFLLAEYHWQGNKEATSWLKDVGVKNEFEKRVHTNLAKKIAEGVKQQTPSFWWRNSWTSKNR